MELPRIESKGSLSIATVTTADSYSQEGLTQFNEGSENIFTPHNVEIETSSSTAESVKSSVKTDAGTTSKPIIKLNIFSKKKCSSYICLAFVILFVLAILIIPIIMFITLSPQEQSFLDQVDFQSCSVSSYMFFMHK